MPGDWRSYFSSMWSIFRHAFWNYSESQSGSFALQVNKNQNSLLSTIAAISSFDSKSSVTLNAALDNFKMRWILLYLDKSLGQVNTGQETKINHDSYALSKIKSVQQFSLLYHPDKQKSIHPVVSNEMQRQVNTIVIALRNVHNYVMSAQTHPVCYIYRLFGEISLELLSNGTDLGKVVNILVCSKVYDIAYWKEGKLMEIRNGYLHTASSNATVLNSKIHYLLAGNDVSEFFKNESVVGKFKDIKETMCSYKKQYKNGYCNNWLNNLKSLHYECELSKELKIIQLEVKQLLKESEVQYKLLSSHNRYVNCDEIFIKPVLDYSKYFEMYFNVFDDLKKDIHKKISKKNFREKRTDFWGVETNYIAKIKQHIEACLYDDLFYVTHMLVEAYLKRNYKMDFLNISNQSTSTQFEDYIDIDIANSVTRKQIRHLVVFALQRFPPLIQEKYERMETFFDKEKRRADLSNLEYNEMKHFILKIEAENKNLELNIREEINAKVKAEKIMDLINDINQKFILKICQFDELFLKALVNSQPLIVHTVAEYSVDVSCNITDVLDHVIKEIVNNREKVIQENYVSKDIVERALSSSELNIELLNDALEDFLQATGESKQLNKEVNENIHREDGKSSISADNLEIQGTKDCIQATDFGNNPLDENSCFVDPHLRRIHHIEEKKPTGTMIDESTHTFEQDGKEQKSRGSLLEIGSAYRNQLNKQEHVKERFLSSENNQSSNRSASFDGAVSMNITCDAVLSETRGTHEDNVDMFSNSL